MTTVLVTGGAGFIGSHVADALLRRGDRVLALDNFNDYYSRERKRQNLAEAIGHPNFRLIEGDIRDEIVVDRIFNEASIDKVVHIAALCGVRSSIDQPLHYQDVNLRGLIVVLEACRRHAVKTLIFASSSSVYGADSAVPFREDALAEHPVSPYAATKRSGEILCATYHRLFGLSTTCLRFFTVYGPRGRPDMAPYLFTQRVLAAEPITMFGDGTTTRDYTYVDDIVAGIVAAIDAELPCEIVNLGNSASIRLRDFIRVIEDATGRQAIIRQSQLRPGDVPHTFAHISKARYLLGYDPKTPVTDGMQRFVEWYRTAVLSP